MSEDFDKYLAIANHDIQMANNMGELKNYVASILYDSDRKVELLQQKEDIIKEVREYIEIQQKIFDDYDITLDTILKNILEILDKGE